jgi:hypothetical protein
MPYILKHETTGLIAAATLRNIYDLDYYGAEWWTSEDEALQVAAGRSQWHPVHITEAKLKILNVKLNNNQNRSLFLNEDGTLRIEFSSAD